MSKDKRVILITVAGGQPAFDEVVRQGLADQGVAFAGFDLDSELERVLDALESGAMPIMLKPAPR